MSRKKNILFYTSFPQLITIFYTHIIGSVEFYLQSERIVNISQNEDINITQPKLLKNKFF